MSVINQMLRDLDERQASEQERAGLPPRLRPLPPARARRREARRMLVLGIAIGAAVTGVAVALVMSLARTPAPDSTPPAQASAPALPLSPAPSAPLAQAGPSELTEMKLSTQIVKPAPGPESRPLAPAPAAAPQTAARPPAAAPVAPPDRPVRVPVVPAVETAKGEPAPAEAGQIERRPRGGQARELADAEYRKGMQAVRRGDPAAALPPLRKALEFDPTLGQARQALLSVLVSQRLWPEAQQVAQAGLELDPRQSGWAVILARLQFEQGDTAGAVTTLENYAVHANADADYQSLFAFLLQKQQRPAEAAQRFQTALALRPNEGRWWFGLATAHEALGRSEEAREAYARARAAGNLPAELAALAEQKLK